MIHQYQQNGLFIVLDTYSGSIHLVDEIAYDCIAQYERYSRKELIARMLLAHGHQPGVDEGEIAECLDDIAALAEMGKLFSKDPFAGAEDYARRRKKPVLKALCLHVAHSCNLRCDYCFAGQGHYKGQSALMPFEVGKRALDYLVSQSEGRVNLEVDFFGGEPLMNWDVVKQLVAYARSIEEGSGKRFRFTLTTNGLLLNDDVMDFANREMHNVVLSLDGRREVHDALRHTQAGGGSYDLVVPKFQEFVRRRGEKEYYLRGTFTHYNTDFTEDIFHMAELGFRELSMEPVVCDPGEPWALTGEDLPRILEQYEILGREMLRRRQAGEPFTFYHYMLDLQGGPCLHRRMSGCGSGTEYLAVTPEGALYPCHQFVGEAEFCLGNVWDGVTKPEISARFAESNLMTKPACADCWAKLYCAGGCAANAYFATGELKGVHEYGCTLFKKRMECAIALELSSRALPAR